MLVGGRGCDYFLHVGVVGRCVMVTVVDEVECVMFVFVWVSVAMGGDRLTALCSTIMSLNSPLACVKSIRFSACHSCVICWKTPAWSG